MNHDPVDTRELLQRNIIRIRRDLATVQQLAEIVGVNEEIPKGVTRALDTLDAWTRKLLRTARRKGSPGRPPRPT